MNIKPLKSRGYDLPLTDKTLKKFKKNKCTDCHSDLCLNPVALPFYSGTSLKISKFLSHFGFKVFFKPVNKIKFFLS